MPDPTQVVTLKPRRGVKKVAVDPKRAQELLMRVAVACWLDARLVVIPTSEWEHLSPHERSRVRNVDLIANRDADPRRNKEEKRGWMFSPPGCVQYHA